MTKIDEIKSMLTDLSAKDKEELAFFLSMEIVEPQFSESAEIVGEIACPVCGSTKYVKNGRVRKKQRFMCRGCGRTFGVNSKSVITKTKLTTNQWNKYIHCMINGLSLRKCAEIVGVCLKTSFFMRHKVLDAINSYMERGNVSGVIEMDETFLAESFKGNHKKSGFEIPRKSRKRGKQVSKRGISREQICIGTAIDRNGDIIMTMACKGRITYKQLESLYTGHVTEGSTICTDSLHGYKTLSEHLNLSHKRIPSGEYTNGIFNLARVNSLHSRYKGWMEKFNGVATKFLPNYLAWFKWVEMNKDLRESAKPKKMWADAMAKRVDVRIETIRQREPIWI